MCVAKCCPKWCLFFLFSFFGANRVNELLAINLFVGVYCRMLHGKSVRLFFRDLCACPACDVLFVPFVRKKAATDNPLHPSAPPRIPAKNKWQPVSTPFAEDIRRVASPLLPHSLLRRRKLVKYIKSGKSYHQVGQIGG